MWFFTKELIVRCIILIGSFYLTFYLESVMDFTTWYKTPTIVLLALTMFLQLYFIVDTIIEDSNI